MDVVEYVAASGLENFDILLYVASDFLRLSKRQNVLGIDSAAPEDKLLPELLFQLFRVHINKADLNGIEDIYPVVDKFRDKLITGAAGMIPDFGIG